MKREKEPRALVRNAADQSQVEDSKLEEQHDADLLRDGILLNTQSKAGRHLLWRFLERGSIFRSTWQSDPAGMAFAEGQRNMALWLVDQVTRHDPDAFLAMLKEHATG